MIKLDRPTNPDGQIKPGRQHCPEMQHNPKELGNSGRSQRSERQPLALLLRPLGRSLLLLGSLSLLTLTTGGCYKWFDRDDDETLVVSETQFAYDVDSHHSSEEVRIFWTTVLEDAIVRVRIRNFYNGYARLRIYDGDGLKIFDKDYDDYDNELDETNFTELGASGQWQVRLEYFHLEGHLYLNLE